MSAEAATAFLDRLDRDPTFAADVSGLMSVPEAVHSKLRDAGFEFSGDEFRDAFMERYRSKLTPEQLEAVSAGADLLTILATFICTPIGGIILAVTDPPR